MEANRKYLDRNQSGRLLGSRFWLTEGDAIQPPNIFPDAEYTSGPYGRAAWLLTQIRAQVGEKLFWRTLSQFLQTHAYGYMGTDDFIEAFRPSLGNDLIAKVKKALVAQKMPEITVAQIGNTLELGLEDPDGAMIRPLFVGELRKQGEVTLKALPAGQKISLVKNPESVFFLDPQDENPLYYFHIKNKAVLGQFLISDQAAMKELFAILPPNAQEFVLSLEENWNLEPEDIASLYSNIHSDSARIRAIQRICHFASKHADEKNSGRWKNAIQQLLVKPPYFPLYANWIAKNELASCQTFLDADWLLMQHEVIQRNPAQPALSQNEILFLAHFDSTPSDTLATWGRLALEGIGKSGR